MRTRACLLTPPSVEIFWPDDDANFFRTTTALAEAVDDLDLPTGTLEETVKIVRLSDDF